MLDRHRPLFQPLTLGRHRLPNRVCLAPTYVGAADERGRVTDQSLCYYYARARGGLGLVIVEIAGVTGRYAFSPGMGLGAASERHTSGLSDLARVIHWGGARAVLQLLAGQGAQALTPDERRPLVGPSDVPALLQRDSLPNAVSGLAAKTAERPRPLTGEEVEGLKRALVRAADRARRAGFDGVELHGAHGYLLGQFTSPYYNRRDDEYGGSPERRWRISLELVREIRASFGSEFIVGYRFSARERVPGGLELDESVAMGRALAEAGADYLSVSQGCYGSATAIFPREEGAITADAAAVRRAVGVAVMCPNFQDPDLAAQAVADGSIDLVALSRPLLADPHWARKVEEGRAGDIQRCVRCYQCVRSAIVDYTPVRCPVNPELGFERFNPAHLPRPSR